MSLNLVLALTHSAYDLDDDGDLSLEHFISMIVDIMAKNQVPGAPMDQAAAEAEARRLHKGGGWVGGRTQRLLAGLPTDGMSCRGALGGFASGRVSKEEFVAAVDSVSSRRHSLTRQKQAR
jgi:hypothetical protein